jgi:hypothetical protein
VVGGDGVDGTAVDTDGASEEGEDTTDDPSEDL